MRHMKSSAVSATIRQVVEKTTCDLCGDEIKQGRFDAERVEISYTTGKVYPECGDTKEVSVDMCGNCFETKLIPWLKSYRVNLRTEEWSW